MKNESEKNIQMKFQSISVPLDVFVQLLIDASFRMYVKVYRSLPIHYSEARVTFPFPKRKYLQIDLYEIPFTVIGT